MNFTELSNWKLTDEECASLKKLLENKDFIFFRDYLEKKLVKEAFDLATGTFVEGIDRLQILNEVRGMCRFWKEVMWKLEHIKEQKDETKQK